MKKDDIDFEIKFYEGILDKKPDFINALRALGDLYTKRGLYEKGLAVDEKLAALKSDDPEILYNLACSYSLLNNLDNAFITIKRAIESGYDNFTYLQADNDLTNLRNDARFKRYFEKLINKKIAK